MLKRLLVLAVFLLSFQAAWADVTVRQTLEFKFGSVFPPAVVDTVKAQMGAALPTEMTIRVKGHTCSSSVGAVNTSIDYDKGEITILNSQLKQVARVPIADYLSRVVSEQVQIPAAAQQAFQNMKFDVQSNKTGQMAIIQGLQAEEYLIAMSIDMMPGFGMKLEMHDWVATTEESNRNPALKELATCTARGAASFDPTETIQKMFAILPGMADSLQKSMAEFKKTTSNPTVRVRTVVYAPALMAMAQAQGQALPAGSDPNAPLMEMNVELAELSTSAIPDDMFAVPAGYTEGSLADLTKRVIIPLSPSPAKPPQFTPPTQPTPGGGGSVGIGIAGGAVRNIPNISPPRVIRQQSPQYTEEARRAALEGTVRLSIVVNQNGDAENIRVIKSLDPGLDQKAIEAVQQWKFQPGQKDGQPVAVQATAEVNFRLLDTPK